MKLSTFLIAFGPAIAVLGIKFAIEPSWLKEMSFQACLGLGAAMGAFGAIAARTIEPGDSD